MISDIVDRLPEGRARSVLEEHGARVAKYVSGSIAATVVSTAVFMATFGPGLLGSRSASLAASAAGAVVNYFLNRHWTWGQRGRGDFRREVLPYWTTVVVNALIAAVGTGAVNAIVRDLTSDRGIRTVVDAAAYVTIYGLSFLVKYRIFHRLFGGDAGRSS